MLACTYCGVRSCNKMNGDYPKGCPSLDPKEKEIEQRYLEEENYKIANVSAEIVVESYGKNTRIMETVDFAKRCGYTHIGLAFCVGLSEEAKIVQKVFEYHGLKVSSVICKVGGVSREFVGVDGGDKPVMCNPIAQAEYLNDCGAELNVLLGLCVGHDSLFFKYAKAPTTVLAVKDRVLGNNPIAAVYQANAYYKNKLFPPKD